MNPQQETQEEKEPNRPKALAVMANRLNVEPQKLLQTLKDTVFKGANDSELLALVVVANEYGLSPLLKEIYAFPAKGGGITPVVSIDGWISMVNRQPQLDGLEFEWVGGELPESCTCTIFIKNRTHPVRVTEFYKECFRATEPWKQMPRRMLRHKALKEAARVAFGFSGITDEDEARDIMRNADARMIDPKKEIKAPGGPVRTEQPDFAPPAAELPKKAKAKEVAPQAEDVDVSQEKLFAEQKPKEDKKARKVPTSTSATNDQLPWEDIEKEAAPE
jgi:phage recombination protein Bet